LDKSSKSRITLKSITYNFNIFILFGDCLLTGWGNSDINQVEFSSSFDLVLPRCREVRNSNVLFENIFSFFNFVFEVYELVGI